MPRLPPVRTGIERADYPEEDVHWNFLQPRNQAVQDTVDPTPAEQERQHQTAAASAAGQSTGISANQQGKQRVDEASISQGSAGTSQNPIAIPEDIEIAHDEAGNRIATPELKRLYNGTLGIKGHQWPEKDKTFFKRYCEEFTYNNKADYTVMSTNFQEFWKRYTKKKCESQRAVMFKKK